MNAPPPTSRWILSLRAVAYYNSRDFNYTPTTEASLMIIIHFDFIVFNYLLLIIIEYEYIA